MLRSLALALVLAGWLGVGPAEAAGGFSRKPVYIDPALRGWAPFLTTLCFRAGCAEDYFVAGAYIGRQRDLNVVCKSQRVFERLDREQLGAFATRLARHLGAVVEDIARDDLVDGVVLTFYCLYRDGEETRLEVYQCCLPAHSFGSLGPVPLRVEDRRSVYAPRP
ncbi:MAG: hypothetical protein Kow0092_24520 [Deferrisomatales bacterium]